MNAFVMDLLIQVIRYIQRIGGTELNATLKSDGKTYEISIKEQKK